MKIHITSVPVKDQEQALQFYTTVLGFIKKFDLPMGNARWLTVVAPEGSADVELLLEPMHFAPARTYQQALFDAGIPYTSFAVSNIESEYERLKKLGVVFKSEPKVMGPVKIAVFDTGISDVYKSSNAKNIKKVNNWSDEQYANGMDFSGHGTFITSV